MTEYFYHVYIEDEDGNIEVDRGFFCSFANVYSRCSYWNEELGNDSGDYETLYKEVRQWGRVRCGCFTIVRCEFED